MSHDLLDQRDEYCRPMERQMPRPTVLEVCREAFLLGAETMCQQVESAVERALHEQEAREHLRNLEMAVDQSSFGDASDVVFDVVEADAAGDVGQDVVAEKSAEEPVDAAPAAAAAAAPAAPPVPEIALRGSAEEVVAVAPAAAAPAQ